MARRPLPTGPADWLVLAVTPALLVGMVTCLLFFLLAVFYRGEFNERLHWILYFGVVGMVLIGRINLIEEIARRASLYSGILGLLVVIALIRFVPPPPGWPEVGHYLFCAVLVALGFWATRLLVADTTDINSETQIDGEGLLRAAGLEDDPAARLRRDVENRANRDSKKARSLQEGGEGDSETDSQFAGSWEKKQNRRKPPGVTVVWFSALALPVFGIGQGFIPAEEIKTRWFTLMLLTGYMGCAFLLLLTSCFLGFRRYLARRGLSMPPAMSAVWIIGGMLLVGCVLLGALIIPRPSDIGPLQTLSALLGKKIEPIRKDKPAPDESSKGATQQTGKQMDDQQDKEKGAQKSSANAIKDAQQSKSSDKGTAKAAADKSSKNGQGKEDGKSKAQQSGDKSSKGGGKSEPQAKDQEAAKSKGEKESSAIKDPRTGDKKSGNTTQGKEDQSKKSENKSDKQSDKQDSSQPPPPPPTSPTASQFMEIMRKLGLFIVTGLAVGLVVGFAITCMAMGWSPAETLNRWITWFQALFAKKQVEHLSNPSATSAEEDLWLSFSDIPDPFSGRKPLPERELVRITFRAIRAWGNDAGDPMLDGETPNEYCRRLASLHPVIENDLTDFCGWHDLAEYAKDEPLEECQAPIRELWRGLRNGARLNRKSIKV